MFILVLASNVWKAFDSKGWTKHEVVTKKRKSRKHDEHGFKKWGVEVGKLRQVLSHEGGHLSVKAPTYDLRLACTDLFWTTRQCSCWVVYFHCHGDYNDLPEAAATSTTTHSTPQYRINLVQVIISWHYIRSDPSVQYCLFLVSNPDQDHKRIGKKKKKMLSHDEK